MYGIRPNVSLAFLRETTIVQVCFGSHDLVLNFAEDIRIAIFSSVSMGFKGGPLHKYGNSRDAAADLFALLDKHVDDVAWTADGTLTLTIADRVLQIHDDSDRFESYVIRNGTEEVVV
jgi:hypothetical protein